MSMVPCIRFGAISRPMREYTVWDPVVEAICDTIWVLLVFSFEFVFARFTVASREDVRYKFIVLAELRKSLALCESRAELKCMKLTS